MDFVEIKKWTIRGLIGFIFIGLASLIFPPLKPLISIEGGITIFGEHRPELKVAPETARMNDPPFEDPCKPEARFGYVPPSTETCNRYRQHAAADYYRKYGKTPSGSGIEVDRSKRTDGLDRICKTILYDRITRTTFCP